MRLVLAISAWTNCSISSSSVSSGSASEVVVVVGSSSEAKNGLLLRDDDWHRAPRRCDETPKAVVAVLTDGVIKAVQHDDAPKMMANAAY